MISASSKKNTVNERRIEIDSDTCSMERLVTTERSKSFDAIIVPFLQSLMAGRRPKRIRRRFPHMG